MYKKVHAIWLGNRMPPLAHACLDDWRKMGFEFKLWTDTDESILEMIDSCSFSKECYKRKLFAFVSDYLRLKILQQHGGLYLDTDVTIRKDPFPLFSEKKFVAGYESANMLGTAAIYAEPDSVILDRLINFYENDIWNSELYIGPQIFTRIIVEGEAFKHEPSSLLDEETFYPYKQEALAFSCPETSYLVHWFQHSWKETPGIVFLKSKHQGILGKLYVWQKYFFRRFF